MPEGEGPSSTEAVRALREALASQGRELLEDPRRTRALLRDLCPGQDREIAALVLALDLRIPQELEANHERPAAFQRSTEGHLVQRLVVDRSIQVEVASWVVSAWKEALGLAPTGSTPRLASGLAPVSHRAVPGGLGPTPSSGPEGTTVPWSPPTVTLPVIPRGNEPPDPDLRLQVVGAFEQPGRGTVVSARVTKGRVQVGDPLVFMPSGRVGEVASLELHDELVSAARSGETVLCGVSGVASRELPRGEVGGLPVHPPVPAASFLARVQVVAPSEGIAPGQTGTLHCGVAEVPCAFSELRAVLDRRTMRVQAETPSVLHVGELAVVRLTPRHAVVVEPYSENPSLGAFVVIEAGRTLVSGQVIEVDPAGRPS